MVVCGDCKGIIFVGGINAYQCAFKADVFAQMSTEQRRKVVEERIEINCDKYDVAPRGIRIRMKDYVEVSITEVHGGGRVQIPQEIRSDLELKDGDKILWIRKGRGEYTFRKVGGQPAFKPIYR